MDVLTDTMSTTQMQSKTGRVDSYDAMVEAERKKMYSILDAQAAVKAEDYAYDDEEDAIRRDASDDLFAGYKAGKASQADVKAENDAYADEEDAILRDASDDFYAGYRIGKASQAAVPDIKRGRLRKQMLKRRTMRTPMRRTLSYVMLPTTSTPDIE